MPTRRLEHAVAVLELLAAAARAGLVASDLRRARARAAAAGTGGRGLLRGAGARRARLLRRFGSPARAELRQRGGFGVLQPAARA